MELGFAHRALSGRAVLESHLGGEAVWAPDSSGEVTLAKDVLEALRCPRCEDLMSLVVQVETPYEAGRCRYLYVYACLARSSSHQEEPCLTSGRGWTVIRREVPAAPPASATAANDGIQQSAAASQKAAEEALASAFAAGGEGDFGFNLEELTAQLDSLTLADEKAAATKDERQEGSGGMKLPREVLATSEVTLPAVGLWSCYDYSGAAGKEGNAFADSEGRHVRKLLQEYKSRTSAEAGESDDDEEAVVAAVNAALGEPTSCDHERQTGANVGGARGEEYERGGSPDDLMFEKFTRIVSKYPRQVLRYCYGGEPLWMYDKWKAGDPAFEIGGLRRRAAPAGRSSSDEGAPAEGGKCRKCFKERKFEMQIMPSLFNEVLRSCGGSASADVAKAASDAWTCIAVVYTCSDNCACEGGVVEVVKLQKGI